MQDPTETVTDATVWQILGERAPIGMAVVSGPDRRLMYVNPSFSRLAGSLPVDVCGRTIGEVLQPRVAAAVGTMLDAAESGSRPWPVNIPPADGGTDGAQIRVCAWVLDERERTMGVMVDPGASEQRNSDDDAREARLVDEIRTINARLVSAALREEQLAEQAQSANRAKSDFLALVSHELRTPLTSVIGYTELLQSGTGGLNEKGGEWAERIRMSAWHLREIVDDLISTIMEERGGEEIRPESVPAVVVVRDAVTLVELSAVQKGLELRVDEIAPDLVLFTDPRRVRQVLTNLLFNAVKFTERGTVTLDVQHVGDGVEFRVSDTGIGIADGDLERIFEPFVQVDTSSTRRFGGCGLGLGLSRRYARALGGDLTVTSVPGSGSTFTFSLPIRADAPAAASMGRIVRNNSARPA